MGAYPLQHAEAEMESVIRHLDASAKIEVLSRNLSTPEELFGILSEGFGDQRPLTRLIGAFHASKQGMGDGVMEYSHAVRIFAKRATE